MSDPEPGTADELHLVIQSASNPVGVGSLSWLFLDLQYTAQALLSGSHSYLVKEPPLYSWRSNVAVLSRYRAPSQSKLLSQSGTKALHCEFGLVTFLQSPHQIPSRRSTLGRHDRIEFALKATRSKMFKDHLIGRAEYEVAELLSNSTPSMSTPEISFSHFIQINWGFINVHLQNPWICGRQSKGNNASWAHSSSLWLPQG